MKNFYCLIAALIFAVIVSSGGAALASTQKYIYLTFDDGPSANITPLILEILKEQDVKATFFLVGSQAELYPNIVRKIYQGEHKIGLHSYSHDYKQVYLDELSLLGDIKCCEKVIEKIIPTFKTNLYRFPGGSFGLSEKFIDLVKKSGYKYFDWNASNRDTEIKDATPLELLNSVISTTGSKKNVILLMHDCGNKAATALSLRDTIKFYKQSGYIFKTLS